MRAVILTLFLLCSAPAFADVEQLADGTFRIVRTDKSGVFGDPYMFRNEVIREADEFAAAKGKVVEQVNLNERGPGFMRFAKVEYVFRLVDPQSADESKDNPVAEQPGAEVDIYAEILKLDDLRTRGLITDQEFEAEKRELLESN
jgi:hypothetical protein